MRARDYEVGEELTLVTYQGTEYPVKVVGHNSLECDLIVHWLGTRPLSANVNNTVCIKSLKEVRRQ